MVRKLHMIDKQRIIAVLIKSAHLAHMLNESIMVMVLNEFNKMNDVINHTEVLKNIIYERDYDITNRKIALEVLKINGRRLKTMNIKFQSDREIVLTAVKNDGHALKYANPFLLSD